MDDLQLLMVHADDHSPVVAGMMDDACHREGHNLEQELPEHLWDEGAAPNDLLRQRWGVVLPEGSEGDRLLECIKPLIAARREQQGGHDVLVYRVKPQMTAKDTLLWRKTKFDNGAELRDDLPRYQLIVGDLHQVSLDFQLVQQRDGFVGRLAFDDESSYRRYVDKLLKSEREPSLHDRAHSLFATVHDRTPATTIGYRDLVAPSLQSARRWQMEGRFAAAEVHEVGAADQPSPDDFLRAAAKDEPAVMLSVSHGEGAPRGGWQSAQLRQNRQGAISFGANGTLAGSTLIDKTFLPRGMWLMLACFGAGTPGHNDSKYRHWLEYLRKHRQFRGVPDVVLASLPRAGERPFIAALPKAVLANEHGPLTFIGHIDLAWTYSFKPLDSDLVKSRPSLFTRMLQSALRGDRAGVAFREIPLSLGQAETELTSAIDAEARLATTAQPSAADPRRGHLWMLRQDLLGYILLGDPAAQLPLRAAAQKPVQQSRAALFTALGVTPSVSQTAPAQAPSHASHSVAEGAGIELPERMDLDDLEEAIGKLWAGEGSAGSIAEELGLDKATLRKVADMYRRAGRRALGREAD